MSFGNAFGAFVPRRGGGAPPGPTPDITPYRITVGCSAAPYNDSSLICDILDPGDGSGIAAAVTAANAFAAQTVVGKDFSVEIALRAGVYDFNQPGSPTAPLTLNPGVSLIGPSSASVALLGRISGDQGLLIKQAGGTIRGLSILYPETQAPQTGFGSDAILLIESTPLQPDFITFGLVDVLIRQPNDIDRNSQTLRVAVDVQNNSGTDTAMLGIYFRDCLLNMQGDPNTFSSGPSDNFTALRGLTTGTQTEDNAFIQLDNIQMFGWDNAILADDIGVYASGGIFGAGSNDPAAVVIDLSIVACNSAFTAAKIISLHGDPASAAYRAQNPAAGFTPVLTGCTILATGTGTGVDFFSVPAARITGNIVGGFDTGITCNDPGSVSNIIVANNFGVNVIPANVDLANNEFAHNII